MSLPDADEDLSDITFAGQDCFPNPRQLFSVGPVKRMKTMD